MIHSHMDIIDDLIRSLHETSGIDVIEVDEFWPFAVRLMYVTSASQRPRSQSASAIVLATEQAYSSMRKSNAFLTGSSSLSLMSFNIVLASRRSLAPSTVFL